MRRTLLTAVLFVLVILQISLLPAVRPFGTVPNIVLAAVILVGLCGTVSQALWFALAAGLVLDLASGANFGLQTGLLMLASLATGLVHRTGLAADGLVAPAMLVCGAVVATNLVLALSLASVAGINIILPALRICLIESILTLGAMMILRPLIGTLSVRELVVTGVGRQ